MPDGKRSRRHSSNPVRRCWYAYWRSLRFQRRYGLNTYPARSFASIWP